MHLKGVVALQRGNTSDALSLFDRALLLQNHAQRLPLNKRQDSVQQGIPAPRLIIWRYLNL